MIRKLAAAVVFGLMATAPIMIATPSADAMSMNCVYTGPVVGHPDMQYICYVLHDDGFREVFYAPGPSARP